MAQHWPRLEISAEISPRRLDPCAYAGLGDRGVCVEAPAVDLQVLHYTLHVVAGLSEWDALDPVDRVDLRDFLTWINEGAPSPLGPGQ